MMQTSPMFSRLVTNNDHILVKTLASVGLTINIHNNDRKWVGWAGYLTVYHNSIISQYCILMFVHIGALPVVIGLTLQQEVQSSTQCTERSLDFRPTF